MKTGEAIILANGEFPKKGGVAWRLLAAAKRVVACDGAADAYRRRFGKWPDVVVGDLDSVVARHVPCRVVRDADQETNDLEKAMAFCAKAGWRDPVIVGATGKREDHTLGNVFRALACGVEIVTDHGRFVPVCGRKAFRTGEGAGISVFAPDPQTKMTSRGLQWPLEGVKFRNLYCATLNRATGKSFTVTSDRPVMVYLETPAGAVRHDLKTGEAR